MISSVRVLANWSTQNSQANVCDLPVVNLAAQQKVVCLTNSRISIEEERWAVDGECSDSTLFEIANGGNG